MSHLSSIPKRSFEILIVDDGSKDGTSDFALKLAGKYSGSDIRIVTLRKNLGKGGAVRHGMLHGRGKRLLMVDADGASRFEDLESLWKSMDEIASGDQAAIVVGSRAHLVKTDAVVKVSTINMEDPCSGATELTCCDLSAHSSGISSCTGSILFCVSSALATSVTRNVVSNYSHGKPRSIYSPRNI